MSRIKDFVENHRWLYWTLKVIGFPFWLIYKIITFIMNFSKIIINTILIICFIAIIGGTIVYAKFYPMYQEACVEAYEKLSNLSSDNFRMLSNTKIYDKDGKKIGEIDSGSYHYVKINKISKWIQKGYISTEDKRFMEHAGIDLQALSRAALALARNDGEVTQGGSTITQQVIKNNLLTQDQTYSRKLTEVMIAPELEKKFSKADIMEFYCNSNYYGNQCYGVETACKYYFGCAAKDVSIAQAAMLCGISNRPNDYNPVTNMKAATEKKEQILGNMLDEKFITKKQYEKAMKEKIKVVGVDKTSSSENYMVSYAIDCAAKQLMINDEFQFKYTFSSSDEQKEYQEKYKKAYGEKSALIRAGGYKIYTSLNPKLQKKLQNAVSNTLSSFTAKDKETKKFALQSAAMCINNKTQYVVAVVGGRNKKDQYNRAFLSTRQPGSTIKPLLDYGPSIDNSITNPSTIVNDHKVYWTNDKKSYSPKNSGGGYRGNVSIREALARSLNTVAFQVFKKTGIAVSISYLDKLKFSSLAYADSTAPAISLGGFTNGVTVNDMCRGYATLENNGQYSSRTCITKIKHETDGVIYNSPVKEECETEVYSPDTSYIMKDMMQGTFNESYGTAHSAYNSSQIYAGKTGTTTSSKDAWFCGFSSYYTTAVWIGYDTPKDMPGMYGGTYPLKIWSSFMNAIHKNKEKEDFEIPSSLVLRKVYGGRFGTQKKKIKYSDDKRYYDQRPGGYEYYSSQNNSKKKEWEVNVLLKRRKQDAEDAVSKFEAYKITNVNKALNFDKQYQKVLKVIDRIPNEYEQKTYKDRAAQKYASLTETVVDKWKEVIDEYYANKKEKAAEQAKIDAEESNEKAEARLKKLRLSKITWFTNQLNKRTYYTAVTKLLIKDGKKALKKCEGYEEYDSLEEAWDTAVKRAKALPKRKAEDKAAPATSDDYKNIDKDKYKEKTSATATPQPTATPVPEEPNTDTSVG